MATVSTHILNAVDGTHASGIPVSLVHLETGKVLVASETDESGRLKIEVDLSQYDPDEQYELVFDVRPYWDQFGNSASIEEVVIRLRMSERDTPFHRPIILSPNGYSMWASG